MAEAPPGQLTSGSAPLIPPQHPEQVDETLTWVYVPFPTPRDTRVSKGIDFISRLYTLRYRQRYALPRCHHWPDEWHISFRKLLVKDTIKHVILFYRPLYRTMMCSGFLENDFRVELGHQARTRDFTNRQISWVIFKILHTITLVLESNLDPQRHVALIVDDKFMRYFFRHWLRKYDRSKTNRHVYRPTPAEKRESDHVWSQCRVRPALQLISQDTDQSRLALRGSRLDPAPHGPERPPPAGGGESVWTMEGLIALLESIGLAMGEQLPGEPPAPPLPN
jgi:hypothetical protein